MSHAGSRSDGLVRDLVSTASQAASEAALGPLTSKFWLHYLIDGICRAGTQLKLLITLKSHQTSQEVEQAYTEYSKPINSFSIR